MESNKKYKKILVSFLLIIYFIFIIKLIVLKNGLALSIARFMPKRTLAQKLELIQIMPFKTIYDYIIGYISGQIGYTDFAMNVFGNIVAFIPLGYLVPLLSHKLNKLIKIFIIAFLISFTIEIVQLHFNLGICDVDDIILNVLGSIIGFITYKFIIKIFDKFKYTLCQRQFKKV